MRHPPHPNQKKYLRHPTSEQIMAVVKYHGVTQMQFERFYNLPRLIICNIKRGAFNLPAKYWHIIFESLKAIEAGKEPPNFRAVAATKFPKFAMKKTDLINELL